MADSDEDTTTFASFGTPFEALEEDAPRKKAIPVHDQIVTDSEGRRRFHGAFTGGFSAGYFNSVGTKEGWQPSTFISSRLKKFERRAQKPEDFMDDEDMGEFGIAPKRITTTEEFLSQEQETRNSRKRMVTPGGSHRIIPGEPVLQDLVLPVKMSVGVELLKKMGWKEGQGVGPRERRTKKKVYGCSLPPGVSSSQTDVNDGEEDIFSIGLLFAPKDTEIFTFTPKDNKHGLGYKGMDPSTALFGRESLLGIDSLSRQTGKGGILGEAFGVGAFEEDDDDIYTADHMSKYDMELTTDHNTGFHGWTGPPKENTKGGTLSIFTATPNGMDPMKSFPPPVIPRDFNCCHKFDNFTSYYKASEENEQKRKTLNAADRGEMLGEEPLPTPKKSVFEYMSKEDKERVLSASKNITPKPASSASTTLVCSSSTNSVHRGWSSAYFGHSSFKPFAKDPAKQARYEEFLNAANGEQLCQPNNKSGLTEWEQEREKEEFARSAALYRPLNSTLAARFTTAKQTDDQRTFHEDVVPAQKSASDASEQTKAARMKMFGKLTRETFEWHPNNILCKRFNIPNPYPGSDAIGGLRKIRRPKFSLGDLITPQSERPLAIRATSSEGELESEKLGNSAELPVTAEVRPNSSKSARMATSDLTSDASVESASNPSSFASSMGSRAESHVLSSEKGQTNGKQIEGDADAAAKRPPMDLFKAIFAESSDNESKASDDIDDDENEVLGVQNEEQNKTAPATAGKSSYVGDATDGVLSDRMTLEASLTNVHKRASEKAETVLKAGTQQQLLESSSEVCGPTLPPSLRYIEASDFGHEERGEHSTYSGRGSEHKGGVNKDKRKNTKKRYSDLFQGDNEDSFYNKIPSRYSLEEKLSRRKTASEEDLARKRRGKKGKWKDERRSCSESSDGEDSHRSKHRHKRKEKKKHKHRHKHTGKSKQSDDKKVTENKSISLSDDKQIVDKLKNLQKLKDGKRLRAVDFM